METLVFGLLNGVSYGLLLFMLSSGLTLIFSMMGVLNLDPYLRKRRPQSAARCQLPLALFSLPPCL